MTFFRRQDGAIDSAHQSICAAELADGAPAYSRTMGEQWQRHANMCEKCTFAFWWVTGR